MPTNYLFNKIKQKEAKNTIKRMWDEDNRIWANDETYIVEVFMRQ